MLRWIMNRQQFFIDIAERLTTQELSYVQKAYWLVKEAHRKQSRRMTGERYFEHVRRVAHSAAITYGYCTPEVIALGLLHDVVEDTFVPPDVIVSLFGQQMYHDCLILSKEIPAFDIVTGRMLNRAKQKEDHYYAMIADASRLPRIIKGCDRIDNLADFDQWEPARREKYERETRTYVLPIVRETDSRMADEIERRLAKGMVA